MSSNFLIDDRFLRLNISGRSFLMKRTTAQLFKGSLFEILLAHDNINSKIKNIHVDDVFFVKETSEFFVERSPILFDLLLQRLCNSENKNQRFSFVTSSSTLLNDEMRFWRLLDQPKIVNNDSRQNNCIVNSQIEKQDDQDQDDTTKLNRLKNAIWKICEEKPLRSWQSITFYTLGIMFIITSVANTVASTVPSLRSCTGTGYGFMGLDLENSPDHIINKTIEEKNNETEPLSADLITTLSPSLSPLELITIKIPPAEPITKRDACEGGIVFDIIESVCVAWFTLELLLRFYVCPSKRAFVKSFLNIVDASATLPFYIELMVWALIDHYRSASPFLSGNATILTGLLRMTRMLRVARVIRLARYFDSVKTVGETAWNSRSELGLLGLFLIMGVVSFSTLIYYFEKDVPDMAFESIPATFWWAIVTLTTTGYGDAVPKTIPGRIFAGIACVMGVLLIGFPVSILVDNFRSVYSGKQRKQPVVVYGILEELIVGAHGHGHGQRSVEDNEAYEKELFENGKTGKKNFSPV